MNEFVKRIITAVFLMIGVFFAIKYLPLLYFSILLFIIISLAALELKKITNPGNSSLVLVIFNGLIIGFSFISSAIPFEVSLNLRSALIIILFSTGIYFLISVKNKTELKTFPADIGFIFTVSLYIYLPLFFLFELKNLGPNFLFFLIFVIAVGDSGAYFVGSFIGKHKIYPIASPKKSLEGLIAAVVFASVSGWLSTMIFPVRLGVLKALITGGVIGLLSQVSDPIESLFKRAGNKKDSGSILPGHGGVLDRLDSYILCAPALFFLIKFFW